MWNNSKFQKNDRKKNCIQLNHYIMLTQMFKRRKKLIEEWKLPSKYNKSLLLFGFINLLILFYRSMDHNFSIHMPSHFFLSHLLQKFIINFLEKGFNTLVNEFYNVELPSFNHHVDPSLYFWILTYFCRFCTIRKVDMKYIRFGSNWYQILIKTKHLKTVKY